MADTCQCAGIGAIIRKDWWQQNAAGAIEQHTVNDTSSPPSAWKRAAQNWDTAVQALTGDDELAVGLKSTPVAKSSPPPTGCAKPLKPVP